MGQVAEVFVGIDVAKARNAIAVADGERGGEVRYLGEVEASAESMRRLVKRIEASRSLGDGGEGQSVLGREMPSD